VTTTRKVVHIKRKPKIVVVRASTRSAASPRVTSATYASVPVQQQPSASRAQSVSQVDPARHDESRSEPQDRSEGEDHAPQAGEQESHGDSQEQVFDGND
jgi:hypothetical protein